MGTKAPPPPTWNILGLSDWESGKKNLITPSSVPGRASESVSVIIIYQDSRVKTLMKIRAGGSVCLRRWATTRKNWFYFHIVAQFICIFSPSQQQHKYRGTVNMNEQSVNSPGAYNKLYSSPVYVALYCISVPVLAKNILKKKRLGNVWQLKKKKNRIFARPLGACSVKNGSSMPTYDQRLTHRRGYVWWQSVWWNTFRRSSGSDRLNLQFTQAENDEPQGEQK